MTRLCCHCCWMAVTSVMVHGLTGCELQNPGSGQVTTSVIPGASALGEMPTLSPSETRPFELPDPPDESFISNSNFPDCVHPGVHVDCADGWCRIPPGCFIWGSPAWEPNRGANNEEQGPVTISHPFEIMQFEVTVELWESLGFEPKFFRSDLCRDPRCPVPNTSWFLAAQFANAMSAAHDPPLQPCYVLEQCEYNAFDYECAVLGMNAESVYECEGYRLPTRAEWQYAARAGTTTTYYSGDITVSQEQHDNASGCEGLVDRNLDPIAWYCANSGDGTDGYRGWHPVGQKLPNTWGLHDMLGNAAEWVHDAYTGLSPEYPARDPFAGSGIPQSSRTFVGGRAISWPSLLRTAKGLNTSAFQPSDGLRLARTLHE